LQQGEEAGTYLQGHSNIELSSIKVYTSHTKFMQKWASLQPILVFIGKSEEVGVCPPLYSMIKDASHHKYVLISPVDPPTQQTYNGQTYHQFEYADTAIGINVQDLHIEM